MQDTMVNYFVVDYESFYSKEFSLRKMTPAEYILDPRFECIGAAIVEGDGGEPYWLDTEPLLKFHERLKKLQAEGHKIRVISHNALFDMCVMAWRFNFVPDLMIDTMGMARAMVVSKTGRVSLEVVGKHLNLGIKGSNVDAATGLTGAQIIGRAAGMSFEMLSNSPMWDGYKRYACLDADLCRGIFRALRPSFPPREFLVQDTILRCAVTPQFQVNVSKLQKHLVQIRLRKDALLERVGLTKADLMSNEKFAGALRQLGVDPPTKISPVTGKTTWAFAKADQAMADLEEDDDPDVQALIAARLDWKSTLEETRSQRLINIGQLTWPGNTQRLMPVALRYSGAHTHRLSGDWKINQQNWNRPDKDDPNSGMLAKSHEAPVGREVLKADASQIEARLVAWLAGCTSLVDAFAAGVDVYSKFASEGIYHRTITKADFKERFVGKQAILGLGFQMGPPRYQVQVRKDSRLQLKTEIIMSLGEAEGIVYGYRKAYPEIPALWERLKRLIPIMAQTDSGEMVGPVRFGKNEITGPNGLKLFYEDLQQVVTPRGSEWRFRYGHKWKKLFGGKLLENIIQFLARIHNTETMLTMRQSFPHVPLAHQKHDELVYLPPSNLTQVMAPALVRAMSTPPVWMKGCPLAAEASRGWNYGDAKEFKVEWKEAA